MTDHSSSVVRVEKDLGVAWVVLNRPEQINAINDAMRRAVPELLSGLEADPTIRVIVLRGEGHRGFCAGADIKETRPPETSLQVRKRMDTMRWIEALDRVSKPLIAAVHGACMGGGLELALACDIRVAAPQTVFALPETGLGLIPGGGGTQRLPRIVGLGRALDLLLTGERINAEHALRIGLITRISQTYATLYEEVAKLAAAIAARPPLASAMAKSAARSALETDLSVGLNRELDLFALLAPSEDRLEAARAFKEKRAPIFSGT